MYSSYSTAAAVTSCVFATLATAFVVLRLWARSVQKQKIGIDDYLIIVALALAFSYCCIVLYASFNASLGQDLSTITPEEYTFYQKHLYVGVIIAHLSYGFVKLGVLQFYKRIFSVGSFILSANITLVFVIIFMITATLVQIFSAWPISNWWTITESYSIKYEAFLTVFAAIDLLLDIVILALPLPVIKRLQIEKSRKVMLLGVFWMGAFCIVATAVRLYYGYTLTVSAGASSKPVSDEAFSNASVNNAIWAEIEACCSIIAACLPTYGPLIKMRYPQFFAKVVPSWLSTRKNKHTGRSTNDHKRKNTGYPLTDNHHATPKTLANDSQGSEVHLAELANAIHVQTSFSTDVERHGNMRAKW